MNMSVLRYAYLKISQFRGKRHGKNFARPDPLELGLRCYCDIKVDVVRADLHGTTLSHATTAYDRPST